MRCLFSYMPIVAVAVLFSLFSCQSKKGEKQSGDVRLPEISVAYPAVDSVVLIKSYPGYLTSLQTVDLVARVNGYLQQVAYTPGEIVKKGQLLFVIEPSQYEDAVEQADDHAAHLVCNIHENLGTLPGLTVLISHIMNRNVMTNIFKMSCYRCLDINFF